MLQPRNIGMYGLGVGDFDNWPVRKPIFKKKNLIFFDVVQAKCGTFIGLACTKVHF